METRIGCASHIGGRAEQQDAVTCLACPKGDLYFLVVADGMGGHAGGANAAGAVIETAHAFWEGCEGQMPFHPRAFLDEFCQQAQQRIHELAERGLETGFSTVAALIASSEEAYWAHVGDSRIYHFEGPRLLNRSKDHTVVQALLDAGRITEEQMATHPDQNKLLRGLGGPERPEVTHGNAAVMTGHAFVVCSDGFWSAYPANEMAALLNARDLGVATTFWADKAARRNGPHSDNVSVAVLKFTDESNDAA